MSEALIIAILGAITTVVVAAIPIVLPPRLKKPPGGRPRYPWLSVIGIGLAFVAIVVALWPKPDQQLKIIAQGTSVGGAESYGNDIDVPRGGLLFVSATAEFTKKGHFDVAWLQVFINCDGAIVSKNQNTLQPFNDNSLITHASAVHELSPGRHRLDVGLQGVGAGDGRQVRVEYYVIGTSK